MTHLSHSARLATKAVTLGYRQVYADKILLLGAFLVYAVIMLLYSGIIKMIPPEDLASLGLTASQMIWYLGITEMVLFCAGNWIFKDVQNDIISEQIHLSLLRPYPTSLLRIMIWLGESAARLTFFVPVTLVLVTLLAGGIETSFIDVVGLIATIPLGIFMLLCGLYAVGASCLWFIQAEPAYWVWQKTLFLLGALLWPMTLYPNVMQAVMWATPFPAILAMPASWALDQPMLHRALAVMHQIFWAGSFLFLIIKYDRIVLRRIQRGGK